LLKRSANLKALSFQTRKKVNLFAFTILYQQTPQKYMQKGQNRFKLTASFSFFHIWTQKYVPHNFFAFFQDYENQRAHSLNKYPIYLQIPFPRRLLTEKFDFSILNLN